MPWLIDEKPFADLERLLREYGMSTSRLARALEKCEATARGKLRYPGSLTLHELQRICTAGHIPADKIREAIKFK